MTSVLGPVWSEVGLGLNGGRYPLGVEAAVLTMVDKLVPGISTQTRFGRYFSLYWALSNYVGDHDLDPEAANRLVRRSEVALGWASADAVDKGVEGAINLHAADSVRRRRDEGLEANLAELDGPNYSTRKWGFFDQYRGPATLLRIVGPGATPGTRECPKAIRQMFAPLFNLVRERTVTDKDLAGIRPLTLLSPTSADVAELRNVLIATPVDGAAWKPDDLTRRAAFRLVARAAQLDGTLDETWQKKIARIVAFGDLTQTDPVISSESVYAGWRGMLLRHYFVGAWRLLFARLVEHVDEWGLATRAELHDWIRTAAGPDTLAAFLASLPPTSGGAGNPLPAEENFGASPTSELGALALLLIGAQRVCPAAGGGSELAGDALPAFAIGPESLGPRWVAQRRDENRSRSLGDFACVLVDDMLTQSRRMTLDRMSIDPSTGRMTMYTKLYEREGMYFANGRESAGNIGLRLEQLGDLALQLGLLEETADGVGVTVIGHEQLGLPL